MRPLLIAFLLFCAPVRATTFATDASDLWYNPGESGWGVNVIQQGDTLFATMFVYGNNSAPVWYVASSAAFTGTQGASFVYAGPLYQTSGPWLGGTFNPNAVTVRQVGLITFRFDTITQGQVSYTVDGVSITKTITRQTWKANSLTASYVGAFVGTYSGACPFPTGYAEEPAVLTVNHSGATLSMGVVFTAGGSCTHSGTYQQAGRMGAYVGVVNCGGLTGTVSAFEIQANISGFTGRGQASFGGSCNWSGRFGGLRRGS